MDNATSIGVTPLNGGVMPFFMLKRNDRYKRLGGFEKRNIMGTIPDGDGSRGRKPLV